MIVTAIDNNVVFQTQLKVLLKSLAVNSPRTPITTFLVNTPATFDAELRSIHSGIQIEHRELVLPEDNRAGVMVCYRSRLLVELMHSHKWVAWFDADVIVRSSLRSFVHLGDVELKIRCRFHEPLVRQKFQAGVFAIGISDATKAFLQEWDEETQKNPVWYSDQVALYLCYMKHRDHLVLTNVDTLYNDTNFSPISHIWHYKNGLSKVPEHFLTEYQKYA